MLEKHLKKSTSKTRSKLKTEKRLLLKGWVQTNLRVDFGLLVLDPVDKTSTPDRSKLFHKTSWTTALRALHVPLSARFLLITLNGQIWAGDAQFKQSILQELF